METDPDPDLAEKWNWLRKVAKIGGWFLLSACVYLFVIPFLVFLSMRFGMIEVVNESRFVHYLMRPVSLVAKLSNSYEDYLFWAFEVSGAPLNIRK